MHKWALDLDRSLPLVLVVVFVVVDATAFHWKLSVVSTDVDLLPAAVWSVAKQLSFPLPSCP
jgi:hypothetical protein